MTNVALTRAIVSTCFDSPLRFLPLIFVDVVVDDDVADDVADVAAVAAVVVGGGGTTVMLAYECSLFQVAIVSEPRTTRNCKCY